tara:strand:- start:754 stop:1011 length:258 start_codon:yes stop_codon:yes gene_type:complete
MTTENERLEKVFSDREYQQHAAEIKEQKLERYGYCATMVDNMHMHGLTANDPADQPRVDKIDKRVAVLADLISQVYERYDVLPRD